MKRAWICGTLLAVATSVHSHGQATSTASRSLDLQVGGQMVFAHTDYFGTNVKGAGGYATLDFTNHFGGEIDFRQIDSSYNQAYERTYEIGGRYHRTYGRFSPYVKALYGRGVFNFVYYGVVVANLAYNEVVGGAGTDIRVLPWLNVRADYEYQRWFSFPPNGLTPQLISVGVAYHFPSGMRKGNRFR